MPEIKRPNILVCVFDSLSADDFGYPEPGNDLPTLSKLCSNGTFFSRAYTPCPESSPARASLFTGLDPCVHGLWTDGVTLPDKELTFAQRLAQAGYATYLAGRYQLAGVSRWTTEQVRQHEFETMDWAHGPLHRSRQNAYLLWLQKAAPERYAAIFTVQANPENTRATEQQRAALALLPDQFSFNHWVGQCVCDWIESCSTDKPFMAIAALCVGGLLGAEPAEATVGESLNKPVLAQANAAIEQILECLDTCGHLHDTAVVVTAARGNANSASNNHVLHEKAVRVPLLISGAGFSKNVAQDVTQERVHQVGHHYVQKSIDTPVSTIDIAPTVLDVANVPGGPRLQGASLLSVLDGSVPARTWSMSRVRKTLLTGQRIWQTALFANNLKLVVCHDEQQHENIRLFDLESDPQENHNLATIKSHRADVDHMIDLMIDARCAMEDRTEPRIAEF